MFCPNCGAQYVEGVKFCANCGDTLQSATPPSAPARTPAQQMKAQTANPVNTVPTAAKVFGWISMVLSCLGIIGMVMIFSVTAMPSYQGSNTLIHSEDAARLIVFFLGAVLGYMFSPLGGISGIISLIIMLTKRNRKKIWLPITGIAIGLVALFGSILATVFMAETI